MKSGAPFFRIYITHMIYFYVKYFSVVCGIIYYKKVAETFLRKKVKLLSVRQNLLFNCVKMPVFQTIFKIFNPSFLYIQEILTRNYFTQFSPWKLEALTLLTVKENFYMNLLRTIISNLLYKNHYYIVILFLCYICPFVSKDFVLRCYVQVSWIFNQDVFKKNSKDFSKHIVFDEHMELVLKYKFKVI